MDLHKFIERVVNDGIDAARDDYGAGSEKFLGSAAGFRACLGLSVDELRNLLNSSHIATEDARRRKAKDYWWYRCYETEVNWVCNCLSAALQNEGLPVIITPTARGVMKAAEILGVK